MNSRLTVADARKLTYRIINPDDPNDPAYLPALNEVCERFFNSGKWNGTIVSVLFDSSAGFITLPPEFLCVLGGQYYNVPVPTYTQFAEYIESGTGQIDETLGRASALFDMGDGWCTQTDITGDCTLRVKITSSDDAGETVRLFGKDEDGNEIYSNGSQGVELTLASPSADTTQQFSVITGMQADPLVGAWSLWQVIGGVETQIGSYRPGETRPRYRRYKTGVTEQAIRVICQRRFVPMTEETDWVIPGNLGAIRLGLEA